MKYKGCLLYTYAYLIHRGYTGSRDPSHTSGHLCGKELITKGITSANLYHRYSVSQNENPSDPIKQDDNLSSGFSCKSRR